MKKPKVLMIAGGLATRMGSIANEIPKCMLPVNGRPLIEHQMDFLIGRGFARFVFCVSHLHEKIESYFGDGSRFGINIEYSVEKEPLGTAGAVRNAEKLINGRFLVYYGDLLCSLDPEELLKMHSENNACATIALHTAPLGYVPSSAVIIGKDMMVKEFLEKPKTPSSGGMLVNSSIYAMEKEALSFIPSKEKRDFGKDVFPLMIKRGARVFGFVSDDFFREVGRPEKYMAFLSEVNGKEKIL